MPSIRHSRGPGAPRQSGGSGAVRARRVWLAWLALLLVFGPSPGVRAQSSAPDSDSLPVVAADSREVLPAVSKPFRPGESLRFSVQYGPIHAGSAWLEVHGSADSNGSAVDTLVARAESNSFFSLTFKVRNRIESVWDSDRRISEAYREDRHEGKYRARSEIRFDQERGEARYDDGRVFPIPPRVQDALSSFYYTRYQSLPIGGSLVFDYHASRRSQPLEVRVLGRDRVHVPAGTFDCIVVEPVLKAGGIFKHSGRLLVWLTADQRRIPVLMKSKVAIGSISVILQSMKVGA